MFLELSGDEITGLAEILNYFEGQLPLVQKWALQDPSKADAIVALCNLHHRILEVEFLENGDLDYVHSSDRTH